MYHSITCFNKYVSTSPTTQAIVETIRLGGWFGLVTDCSQSVGVFDHAALLGSVAAAAYNLTFQLRFATTQICEAVAVAVQTLLAREMAATAVIVTANANDAAAAATAEAATALLLSKEEKDAAAATKAIYYQQRS